MRIPPIKVWGPELAWLVAAALVGVVFGRVWPWEDLSVLRALVASLWGAAAAGLLARVRPGLHPRRWAAAQAAALAVASVAAQSFTALRAGPVLGLLAAGVAALVASLPLSRRAAWGGLAALVVGLLSYGLRLQYTGDCLGDGDCAMPRRCLGMPPMMGVPPLLTLRVCLVPCAADADCPGHETCLHTVHGEPWHCRRFDR